MDCVKHQLDIVRKEKHAQFLKSRGLVYSIKISDILSDDYLHYLNKKYFKL